MMIGVKGKQLCAGNPNVAGQTDGRTDGQTDMVIPVYPPNFVAGGIKIRISISGYALGVQSSAYRLSILKWKQNSKSYYNTSISKCLQFTCNTTSNNKSLVYYKSYI